MPWKQRNIQGMLHLKLFNENLQLKERTCNVKYLHQGQVLVSRNCDQ